MEKRGPTPTGLNMKGEVFRNFSTAEIASTPIDPKT
jgi:hypothetical protein